MKYGRRIIVSIVWVLLGAVLSGCGMAGLVDEFWSGMGTTLLIIGILQLVRQVRYRSSGEYREKVDTRQGDERNRFIANKAWAWAGYYFVLIASVGTIVFKLAGREDLMMISSYSVCLLLLLYYGCWLYLKRKY